MPDTRSAPPFGGGAESLVPPRHTLWCNVLAAAAPEQLDMRVAQDLGRRRIARSHRRTPCSLRLKYLDDETLSTKPLDVKTLCVKMCAHMAGASERDHVDRFLDKLVGLGHPDIDLEVEGIVDRVGGLNRR